MKNPLNRQKPNRWNVVQAALPVRPRKEERAIRAAACAAFNIFSLARKHNLGRPENYVTAVCHVLFALLRAGFPREIPVPRALNRSSVSEAERRFGDRFTVELTRLERQSKAGRRPTQPDIVTQAMAMLPRARGGKGPQQAKSILSNLPPDFRPIHKLMSAGIELAWLRERFNRRKADTQ